MKIEIIPDFMGRFEVFGMKLEVSAGTDVVQRFEEPEYDYLSYLDYERQMLAPLWLGSTSLLTLVEFGIPETKPRKSILECEYREYLNFKSTYYMFEFEQDLS